MTGPLVLCRVTDEPTPEIAIAGHDRLIGGIKEEHIDEWLNPTRQSLSARYAIFDDKTQTYYEHMLTA